MDYELGQSESLSVAFQRIGADVIAEIRTGLEAANTQGIHEARKGCKWLRAVLRLTRSGLDADDVAAELRRIRRLAHLFGGVRDAEIRLISFRSLGVENFEALGQQLEKQAAKEHRDQFSQRGLLQARKAIDAVAAGWSGLHLKRGGWRHVGRGIERSYRRAHQGFHRTERDSTDENIHTWRKRAKDLMYHVRLLRPIKPGRMGKIEECLDDLSDSLGYDHDLIVLTAFLQKARQINIADRKRLRHHIEKHRKEHLTAARHTAEKIFGQTPSEFTAKLESWWNCWRK